MKPQRLKPIIDRDVYSQVVAQKLEFELYDRVFRPIMAIFGLSWAQVKQGRANSKQLMNARAGLAEAILAGRIVFSDGWFKGQFSAAISKELWNLGAKFYPKHKSWKIESVKLPVDVAQAIARKSAEIQDKVALALGHLDKIQGEPVGTIELSEVADKILTDLDRQFEKTTAQNHEIPMATSGYIEQEIKQKYTENLNLYIKEWSDESIVRLREKIQENSAKGYRAENMRQAIINEYGVSQTKAKFLARQETSLMVSSYREANYKEAGINFYQWSTSHDQRVRQSHKDLNGQIFSWNDPPIVDPLRGKRGHPGQDFGCRCVAVPVLMSQMERINKMAKNGQAFKGDLTNV